MRKLQRCPCLPIALLLDVLQVYNYSVAALISEEQCRTRGPASRMPRGLHAYEA